MHKKRTYFLKIFQCAYPFQANYEDLVDLHRINQSNLVLIDLTGYIFDPIIPDL